MKLVPCKRVYECAEKNCLKVLDHYEMTTHMERDHNKNSIDICAYFEKEWEPVKEYWKNERLKKS
jgi:hypothetical protein